MKIGLVAPFEGAYRSLGYDVIWAARLAVREANTTDAIPGYGVELVALDDMGEAARAQEQADKLIVDPDVVVVIGHWRSQTTAAVAPTYGSANLPVIAAGGIAGDAEHGVYALWDPATCLVRGPDGCIEMLAGSTVDAVCALAPLAPESADPGFADRYAEIAGSAPVFSSGLAYDATRVAIAAIARAATIGRPTRAAVAAALGEVSIEGLAGPLAWDATGARGFTGAWGYRRATDGSWTSDAGACSTP